MDKEYTSSSESIAYPHTRLSLGFKRLRRLGCEGVGVGTTVASSSSSSSSWQSTSSEIRTEGEEEEERGLGRDSEEDTSELDR